MEKAQKLAGSEPQKRKKKGGERLLNKVVGI